MSSKPIVPDNAGYFSVSESLDGFTDSSRRIATGATTFFRNPELLHQLTETVLPSVAASGGRFHVWCAGCSTGMEVYSIAMVVLDWMAANRRVLQFKILGSDISDEALNIARAGRYPTLKNLTQPNSLLFNRYMVDEGSGNAIVGRELQSVTLFKQRDIALGSRSHRFELVVCDHVFQYFTETRQYQYLERLVSACQPHGFLYVSTPLNQVSAELTERYPVRRFAKHFYQLQP